MGSEGPEGKRGFRVEKGLGGNVGEGSWSGKKTGNATVSVRSPRRGKCLVSGKAGIIEEGEKLSSQKEKVRGVRLRKRKVRTKRKWNKALLS